jgi:hypothetical protein
MQLVKKLISKIKKIIIHFFEISKSFKNMYIFEKITKKHIIDIDSNEGKL